MKSKLFKVLGVVAVVAMLATALVAPATAMSSVSVSIAAGTAVINTIGNYTVTATLGAQLLGTQGIPETFAAAGGTLTFTAVNAYDMVKVAFTGATPTVATTGGGHYAGGVVSFTALPGTVTFTTQAAATVITYTETAGSAATVAAVGGVAGTAFPNGDAITLTFPAGFTITTPGSVVTAPTSGLVQIPPALSPVFEASHITGNSLLSVSGQTVVFTLGAGDYIGNGSLVYINLTPLVGPPATGVTNPATAGSYTLTMMTSQETTPVTSNVFVISNPIITPLPGVASVYNTAGVLMTQSNSLAIAIGYVNTNTLAGATIKLTAGTYADPINSGIALTIQGTDASAANVIIKGSGSWSLTGLTVVVDKVTIDGSNGGYLTVNAATTGSGTVSNSIIQNGALTVSATGTATSNVKTDTFTVATGSIGLIVNAATTITGSTFNVAGTGEGISGNANVIASGSTFNGVTGGGIGVELLSGAASVISTSKFSGLTEALDVTAPAAVSFGGNTVDKCGVATTGPSAIMVHSTGGTGVQVFNNTITNSLQNIMTVTANDTLVFVMGNQFSGNVGNVVNNTTVPMTGGMTVTHNYWGGTAANPASTTSVSYAMPLGSAPTNGSMSVGAATSLDASATAGVIITSATSTELGAVILGANPVTTALPSTVAAKGYYDVFGVGAASANLQFNGSTAKPIAATDLVYMWNTVYGRWDVVATGANAYGNYVTVTGANISGTVFALVTLLPSVPPVTPDVTAQYPEDGAVNVPIDVTFTWNAVPLATGYQFAIAQDNPDLTNKFAVLDYSANTITNAHIVQEVLLYNTTYWWEVRSVSGTVVSPWTIVSFFTTEKAPAPPTSTTTAPQITVTNTTVTYTNPPVTTTIFTLPQQKGTQPIPSYLLWAVIAVGAVLVIAVIVLIVRTRRMP